MTRALVLMYHRVCARSASTACYFARGTAVTPETFSRHLDWIGERWRFASLPAVLSQPSSEPTCALTFDDGYSDIVRVVEPICAERGIPIAVFPIAERLADAKDAAWFDAYYDLIQRALRRDGIANAELGIEGGGVAPAIDTDLEWWVRGPVKQRIARLGIDDQSQALDELGAALRATHDSRLSIRLYLTLSELRRLAERGVTLGGHGATHRRLDSLAEADALTELGASAALLEALRVPRPWIFCYPDGGHTAATARQVARCGFSWALTVERGAWLGSGDPYYVPRHLMRETTTELQLDAMNAGGLRLS